MRYRGMSLEARICVAVVVVCGASCVRVKTSRLECVLFLDTIRLDDLRLEVSRTRPHANVNRRLDPRISSIDSSLVKHVSKFALTY